MSLNAGCLSFFTPNHQTHAKQWLQKGSEFTLICFACLVEIIENKNEPSIRKTKTLQELLKLVSSGGVLPQLEINEKVLTHLLKCLWEFLGEENKTQCITAIEIIYQLCCALKSETFVKKVVEDLTSTFVLAENPKKVSPQLDLLGKLLQNIPAMTGSLIHCRMNLVSCVGRWTSFPNEETRSLLFFILTHFYRYPDCCVKIPREITNAVFRECCEALTTATAKELQINSIALLQSLTDKESLSGTSTAITCNMGKVITSLKKAFLSTVELVQTLAIACLNNLVQCNEGVISSDLPGFIFEVFNSKSDTLLSLGLQGVSRLLDKKEMYTKGHVIYGFDAILSTLLVAADSKTIKVLRQGFEVLRKVFENCPPELVLISCTDILVKCLDVISKGLTISDDNVVLRATFCLGALLEQRHYGCDLPYGNLTKLVDSVVGNLSKVCHRSGYWSQAENKGLKSSMMVAILEVVNKSLDLIAYGRRKPPSIEALLASSEKSIAQQIKDFTDKLLQLCDQICIPNVISHLQGLHDTTIPESFFKILNKLLQTCQGGSKEMAQKFVSSCFIRIALETKVQHLEKASGANVQDAVDDFLVTICCCILPTDMTEYTKNLLSSSVYQVGGTPQELLQILRQNNERDETLRNTQECIQILFYLAYNNGDRLFPRDQLLYALSTFLVFNPTCYSSNSIATLRCLTQLFITELYRGDKLLESLPLYTNAQRIVADGLFKNMDNLHLWYFQDIALLDWAVAFPNLNPNLRKEILVHWFSHEGERESNEDEFWKRTVDKNPRTLLMLVSMISNAGTHAQHNLLLVVESVLQCCNPHMIEQVMQELKQALQKLFLNQAVEPLPKKNMKSILKLLCLLITTCTAQALDDDYIKLIYHVVNFLTHYATSSGLCIKCLNFLNACIIQDTKHGSDKVLTFLLNHYEYNSFLQTTLHSFQNSTEIEQTQQGTTVAAILVSISSLISQQISFGISTKNTIRVTTEVVLPLLNHSTNPLLRFAANVFWENVLRSFKSAKMFDSNLLLHSEENETGAPSNSERNLTKLHLRMILVYLQNSLLHVNMLIRLTSLRCLEALFSLEEANRFIQDPWNIVMLRECKDFSSATSVAFTMKVYSLFLYHKQSLGKDVHLTNVIGAVLDQIEGSFKSTSIPDLYLSALPEFIKEIIQSNTHNLTNEERSKLRDHVKQLLQGYYQSREDRKLERKFMYLQKLLVHEEMMQGNISNVQNSLNELLEKLDQR